MKKLFLLLAFIQIQFAFSQDKEWDNPEPREFRDTVVHALIASGETLLSNGTLMLINTIYGTPWALPTEDSIKGNFTTPWKWESRERFIVNQLGHPYQGATYFVSGRVNGFNFYESIFFNVLGSFTWEAFCESQHASINDFITTVTGSIALGEMLYRLHLEAYAAGAPLPLIFFVSPTGGFHILVTHGKQTPNPGKNLNQLQVSFGGGYTKNYYSLSSNQQELFSFQGSFGDIGMKLIYGDPFEQDTIIPYRHFEIALSLGLNFTQYNNYRVISDGYLFSFSPICNDTNAMSTGLSMHFDFVYMGDFDSRMYSSTIDQYSNALDWTIKYQHLFSENTLAELKYHAGFTFLGASNYYSDTAFEDELNYGYGFNSKLFFNLENKKLGKLETDILFYSLLPYPGTSDLSYGTVFWLFTDFTYSHFISKHFSAGITISLAREWGLFNKYPDTKKGNDEVKLFIAWNL